MLCAPLLVLGCGAERGGEASLPHGTQQEHDEKPEIRTTGATSIDVAPDAAVVRVGVASKGRRVVDARERAAVAAARMIERVKAEGIAADQVRTNGLEITPSYNDLGQRDGYEARHTLRIRVEDVSKVGAVVDGAVEAGGNDSRLQNIRFEVAADNVARQAARKRAVEEARAKADELAGLLNLEVRGAFKVVELSPASRRPYTGYAGEDGATPIQPGLSKLSVHVEVRWVVVAA